MHGTPLFLFPPYQKPPSNGLRRWRNPKKTAHRHRFAPTARCEKTAEERFNMLARGWLAYPVTSIHSHLPPSSSVCANGAMRKTAEERFNMLARGWLAYPVTPIHSHLPPKSGCRNVIPRFANPMPPHTIQVFYQACFLNDS